MTSVLEKVYFAAGGACLFYYLMLGAFARFGLNMSWLWLVAAAVLALSGLACRAALPGWGARGVAGAAGGGRAAAGGAAGTVSFPACTPRRRRISTPVIVLGARVEADGEPSRAPAPARGKPPLPTCRPTPDAIAVASGGQGADEPVSEAACIREALIAAGIAPERIRLEDRSATTAEKPRLFRARCWTRRAIRSASSPTTTTSGAPSRWREGRATPTSTASAAPYAGVTLPHFMVREAACLVAEWLRGNL